MARFDIGRSPPVSSATASRRSSFDSRTSRVPSSVVQYDSQES
jgi:hypothetical protein